jgi:uncharacterized damage-inducible protein DinB
MSELSSGFVRESAKFLSDVYVPRLKRALELLPAEDLWWRPHESVLSTGVVLTHLEGNVRQWILSGIGDIPDARDRAAEFAATDGADAETLLARLKETVDESCRLIEALDESQLNATYPIQGDDVTGLYAIYHVVEHFAWHTGQAVWIAKARAGANHDLAFFDDAAVNRAQNG